MCIDELQAVSLTFVNDLDVHEAQVQDIQQQDEYEVDSDTERDEKFESQVVSKTCMTKSGRAARAFVRLDLRGQQFFTAIFQFHLQRKSVDSYHLPSVSSIIKLITLFPSMSVPYNSH